MSEVPKKTHRERAERAWAVTAQATSMQDSVRMEPGVWSSPPVAIARLTYPTELVEAAQALLDRTEGIVLDDKAEDDRLARDEGRLRAAIGLYDPPGEPPGKEAP